MVTKSPSLSLYLMRTAFKLGNLFRTISLNCDKLQLPGIRANLISSPNTNLTAFKGSSLTTVGFSATGFTETGFSKRVFSSTTTLSTVLLFFFFFVFSLTGIISVDEITSLSFNWIPFTSSAFLILSETSKAVRLFGSKLKTASTSLYANSNLFKASKHLALFSSALVYLGDTSRAKLHSWMALWYSSGPICI
ncbi:hypothetical protein IEQ34_008991 [Dendrobium chrysotoxum]|uniref:Uncharacterized protein n=1 Tax=Dendrobium chrysotoxum TaxID=161865 RepID=A0AAV7GXD5_DENCH|nr:hypothetical protein IEQ34_008991 [Dendrobium chrysotoxum]